MNEATQKEYREAFVKDCRRKEWEAASQHAWSVAQLNKALAPYQKESDRKNAIDDEVKAIDGLPGDRRYMRVNKDRRKRLEEEAKALQSKADAIKPFISQIQSRIGQFYQEQARWRELAAFAEAFTMQEQTAPASAETNP